MKKASKILLKIARIVDIIGIPTLILCAIGFAIGSYFFFQGAANATATEEHAALLAAGIIYVYCAALFAFLVPGVIVGAIFSKKLITRLDEAKSKSEVKGLAIANIIIGAFSCNAATVGGILALCTKEAHFNTIEQQ